MSVETQYERWTAYDYDNQEWLEGEPARLRLITLANNTKRLILSERGPAFLSMIGKSREYMLGAIEEQLSALSVR